MQTKEPKSNQMLALAVYLYLGIPVIIFICGWCCWYIAVPIIIISLIALIKAVKEHDRDVMGFTKLSNNEIVKIIFIIVIIILWVIMSGIGECVWQNSDHATRNALFKTLETESWPIFGIVDIDGTQQSIVLSYYLGFWLPAALIGKIFGMEAGRVALIIWAVLGIMLFYSLISVWQKRVLVWPLILFIFFSGLDVLRISLIQNETVKIFGVDCLEWWSTDCNFQFSSMTTQLFWVFNQAIPAWIASVYIFLYEKPRNMIFTLSLLIITATFPMAGLIPFCIYFMIKRGSWEKDYRTVTEVAKSVRTNWISWQNLFAGGSIGIIGLLYICTNQAVQDTLQSLPQLSVITALIILGMIIVGTYGIVKLTLKGKGKWIVGCIIVGGVILFIELVIKYPFEEWQSPAFGWADMTIFYILEAGLFLICIYDSVSSKGLLWINAITLYVIPLIRIGHNADFCMRASIPGLVLLSLWCIDAIRQKKKDIKIYALILLLIISAVTPIHEIKRVYSYTKIPYEILCIPKENLLLSFNYKGDVDSFFVRYIAK